MKRFIGLLIFLPLFSVTLFGKGQNASPRFQPPQVLSTVDPSYPPNTVAGGTVVLKVTISSSGDVQNVHVLKRAAGFTQQAINAVKQWKFRAARLDGKPVTASLPVAFSFSQPVVWWHRQFK